jgi:hypothetical protein
MVLQDEKHFGKGGSAMSVNVASGFTTRSFQTHDLRQRQPFAQSQRDRHDQRRRLSEVNYLGRIAAPGKQIEMPWTAQPGPVSPPAEAPAATVMTAAVVEASTVPLRPARRRCNEPHPQHRGLTRGQVLDRQSAAAAGAALYAAATQRGANAMTAKPWPEAETPLPPTQTGGQQHDDLATKVNTTMTIQASADVLTNARRATEAARATYFQTLADIAAGLPPGLSLADDGEVYRTRPAVAPARRRGRASK